MFPKRVSDVFAGERPPICRSSARGPRHGFLIAGEIVTRTLSMGSGGNWNFPRKILTHRFGRPTAEKLKMGESFLRAPPDHAATPNFAKLLLVWCPTSNHPTHLASRSRPPDRRIGHSGARRHLDHRLLRGLDAGLPS